MKRIFEWIGGFALIAFSFYFTDRVTLMVANKSDLMEEIKSVSANYKTDALDAIIDKDANTIIPGLCGRRVKENETYLSMHSFGVFNENYLVFECIKPNKSLSDNKDLYVKSGNPSKKMASLIVIDNKDVKDYLDNLKIKYDLVLKERSNLKYEAEIINGASSKDDFKWITTHHNSNLCLKDVSDISLCKKYDDYILAPSIVLSKINYLSIKDKINNGSLILINDNAKVEDVRYIINELKYKDITIDYVSKLISEEI